MSSLDGLKGGPRAAKDEAMSSQYDLEHTETTFPPIITSGAGTFRGLPLLRGYG